jgi:hypothetical protein
MPPGSRFKGTEDFVVQHLILRVHVVRYRRERRLTPTCESIVAPFPLISVSCVVITHPLARSSDL